ncbi:MAG: hypothetical protein ABIR98_01590 [Usitatibacter sp.]
MIRGAAALLALCLCGCASVTPTHPDAFAFGVMGDTQYNPREEIAFVEMLSRVNREDLAFVVHVGDITGGRDCTDELYARRKLEFDSSAHPLIYTPGDNEWTDCRRKKSGMRDPLERLERLREVFFSDRYSLGARRLEMMVQDRCIEGPEGCRCGPYPENRFWTRGGVRFVTLNVPGSENNTGHDRANDAEARCRNEANGLWLEQAVRASERSETRALVILLQANPWHSRHRAYDALLRQVQDSARRVKRPVLFVHGDTHNQRVDQPFLDTLGNPIHNLVRLETFGSPFIGWVKVTVDPDDPQVFRFDPRLHALVPPK